MQNNQNNLKKKKEQSWKTLISQFQKQLQSYSNQDSLAYVQACRTMEQNWVSKTKPLCLPPIDFSQVC